MTKVEREVRKAWLATLKKGDDVALRRGDGGGCASIVPVRFNSGERIGVDTGRGYAVTFLLSNGRVADRKFHGPMAIFPVTEGDRTAGRAEAVRSRLNRWTWGTWSNVSDATVLKIGEMIDAEEAARKARAKS